MLELSCGKAEELTISLAMEFSRVKFIADDSGRDQKDNLRVQAVGKTLLETGSGLLLSPIPRLQVI